MKTPESAQLELIVKELKKLNKNLERLISEKSNDSKLYIYSDNEIFQEVEENDSNERNEV